APTVGHGGEAARDPGENARALLTVVAAQSPYLAAQLIRDPPALAQLARDPHLTREKDAATQRAELAAELADAPLDAALRRYRNREYLRLGARELGWGAPEAVARELAHLADA